MKNITELTLGFIGFGGMAKAMADGLIRTGTLKAGQIYACAGNYERLCDRTAGSGIHPCRDAGESAQRSDMLIVAVKPDMVSEVLTPIREILRDKIIVSVAAGYPFDRYEEVLLPGTHHISTIPNTPVSVGEGIIICESRHSLTEEEYQLFDAVLSGIGLVQPVDTAQLSIAGTISGCSPAFASIFIEALGDAAVLHGMPRDLSYRLAGQMMAGTGRMMVESGEHPGKMKDAVCSPGGTTIAGVSALEKYGFRSAVIEAVNAAER